LIDDIPTYDRHAQQHLLPQRKLTDGVDELHLRLVVDLSIEKDS
jgi:hypothetical protein